jgi:hypothetical protein
MGFQRSDHKRYSEGALFGLFGSSSGSVRNLSLYSLAGALVLIVVAVTVYGSNQGPTPSKEAASNLSEETSAADNKTKEEEKHVEGQSVETKSTTSQTTTSTSTSSETNLEVNGRSIDVPDNGELHETFEEDGQTTTVNVTNQSSGSSNSTDIDIRSFSSSD